MRASVDRRIWVDRSDTVQWIGVAFGLTRRILPPGNLDELLDVTDFLRLYGMRSA